eukprot:2034673-Heterocapsa_arctica.AAC.1
MYMLYERTRQLRRRPTAVAIGNTHLKCYHFRRTATQFGFEPRWQESEGEREGGKSSRATNSERHPEIQAIQKFETKVMSREKLRNVKILQRFQIPNRRQAKNNKH